MSRFEGLLEPIGHDNRAGNDEAPDFDPAKATMFGFVYFNDDRRVVYATGSGVTGNTGGWEPITPTHIRLAKKYLDGKFPGWNDVPSREREK